MSSLENVSNTTDLNATKDAPAQTEPRQEDPTRDAPASGHWPWIDLSASKLVQAALFGLIFGFLLQKGGVAKFDILIGVLLLENFVVVQVMLSAIIVGMVGVYALIRMGLVEPQIKETVLGANIIGGLVFGIGFGLIAYCPGTDAAAVGQGNLDALVGIAGMILGSYLYALGSGYTDKTIGRWGDLGKITLADVARQPKGVFIAMFLPWLVIVLLVLESM